MVIVMRRNAIVEWKRRCLYLERTNQQGVSFLSVVTLIHLKIANISNGRIHLLNEAQVMVEEKDINYHLMVRDNKEDRKISIVEFNRTHMEELGGLASNVIRPGTFRLPVRLFKSPTNNQINKSMAIMVVLGRILTKDSKMVVRNRCSATGVIKWDTFLATAQGKGALLGINDPPVELLLDNPQ